MVLTLLLIWGENRAEDLGYDPIVFSLIEDSGVDFYIEPSRTEKRHQPETMISGVALFDFDNDGWLDIYAVSGATMTGLKKTLAAHSNRLFRNNGDFTFTDVTAKAGVEGIGYTHGTVVADYDNDGDQDIFVAGLRRNILYRNEGDGTFAEVTKEAGLAEPDPRYGTLWSVAATFVDFNRDGWLDLFVSNYCVWDPETEPACGPSNSRDYCHPQHYEGLPNSLYQNNGDGTFTDISVESGIRNHIGKGMGLGVADFDNDGWFDIYVANDTVPAFLFHNLGDGTFEEIAFESGTAYTYSGSAVSGMGVDAKDVNNDGLPDIFVAAMTNEAMPYYVNLGDNFFDEMTAASKLAMMTRDRTGWGNGIFDLNNDGWKDLFVASGDVMDPRGVFGERVPQPNTLFVNLKNGKFADAAPTAGHEFNANKKVHRGVAFGDIDNDGRIDAVVTSLNGLTEVWRNVSPSSNHWFMVSVRGCESNRDGIGTKLKITTKSGSQYNHVNTAVGYGCASDKRVHFGLGMDDQVLALSVIWPNGKSQKYENLPADQVFEIVEPED
jgi:hypothetical protein